jgi:hypothetical protein
MSLVPQNINEAIKHLAGRSEEEIENLLPKNVVILKNYLNKKNIPYKLETESDDECNFYLINYIIEYHSVGEDFAIWKINPTSTSVLAFHQSLQNVINFVETGRIDESIKHLKPRSEEEIWGFINNNDFHFFESSQNNFELYKKLIETRPFIKEILEDILQITPEWHLTGINKYSYHGRNIMFTFFLVSWGSMSLYIRKKNNINLLLKHEVDIQYPGNKDYGFSISIKD